MRRLQPLLHIHRQVLFSGYLTEQMRELRQSVLEVFQLRTISVVQGYAGLLRMPEIRGQGVIMDKGLLKRLDAMVSVVIREDYTWPKEMDRALDCEICDKEEARFLESLGLMFVKLEAREFALEKTIEDSFWSMRQPSEAAADSSRGNFQTGSEESSFGVSTPA
jgi:hypothetical protein